MRPHNTAATPHQSVQQHFTAQVKLTFTDWLLLKGWGTCSGGHLVTHSG